MLPQLVDLVKTQVQRAMQEDDGGSAG
jgi:hypothetical protein